MKRARFIVAILCAMLAALAGCGATSPEEQILGEWRSADGEVSWIFYDNGNIVSTIDDDTYSGRWYIDERTLSLEAPYETVVFQYEFEGDVLHIYSGNEPLTDMYRFDGRMPEVNSSSEALRSQLESSELFTSTIEELRSEGNADSVSYQFCEADMNDEGMMEFLYDIVYVTQHKFAVENAVRNVVFSYSPLSEGFFFDNRGVLESYYTNWDIVGTWAGELGSDYIELEITSVEPYQSVSDYDIEYMVSYSYNYDNFNYEHTIYTNSGEAVLSSDWRISIEDDNIELSLFLDPEDGINAIEEDGWTYHTGLLQKVA